VTLLYYLILKVKTLLSLKM